MKQIKKKLPIGIENFAKLQAEDFYYVDKTMLIKELLDNWAEVNLFTRPRRFGKTLNMSMLKAFFELNGDKNCFKGHKNFQRSLSLRTIHGKVSCDFYFPEEYQCANL